LTFITQWGRFRYLRAPQGYLPSGDGFSQCDSVTSKDIKNKVTLVDDNLVWDTTLADNFKSVCKLLEIYGKEGLVMNSDKFQFGQDTVEFAGMQVTENGVRPAREFLESIKSFPAPSNISEVGSYFGMINQVNYAFARSDTMEPFRHLLKPGTPFLLSPILQEKFEQVKAMIIEAVTEGVRHYEVGRKTCLATDWSKHGLGFFLLQKWCNFTQMHPRCCEGGWKLVLAGGRFTTPAESRYSECLAVADALHKAKYFVLGCPDLLIATDHKPLLGMFRKPLADIQNPRLLSLAEKTLWHSAMMGHM
jgi:hypothetical protein